MIDQKTKKQNTTAHVENVIYVQETLVVFRYSGCDLVSLEEALEEGFGALVLCELAYLFYKAGSRSLYDYRGYCATHDSPQ